MFFLDSDFSVRVLTSSASLPLHHLVHYRPASEKEKEMMRTVMRRMLDQGVDASAQDLDGETVLHKAALAGTDVAIELLLGVDGVDPNACTRHTKETALHYAVRRGHVSTVSLLIQAGSNTTAQGRFGTPSDVARTCGNTSLAWQMELYESLPRENRPDLVKWFESLPKEEANNKSLRRRTRLMIPVGIRKANEERDTSLEQDEEESVAEVHDGQEGGQQTTGMSVEDEDEGIDLDLLESSPGRDAEHWIEKVRWGKRR